ncbi:GTP-binding protein-like protein Obg [Glonium stellatum]|uniref:GTP-binding protein-like protein Obg n=1 Tax=Glonium stellatum TaxID=574774 RepID=A0A8E2FDJ0_9PEZI|nr:GTP-binding protein-like protein Obg [Glonium stellatum]
MPSARAYSVKGTLTPFLYPFLTDRFLPSIRCSLRFKPALIHRRCNITIASPTSVQSPPTPPLESPADDQASHLNPSPESYSLTPFTDRAILSLHAGSGGHGCVSFVREKYIAEGPPNGGDGGSGGNIYIQAVPGETSLHKLARRGMIKAGRGKNGQGRLKGGERGTDIVISVPVGTIVREISRHDPVTEAEEAQWMAQLEENTEGEAQGNWRRDQWLVFPGTLPSRLAKMEFPPLPKPRRSHLAAVQPQAPIWLDLDKSMDAPMLLAAGAMGGLGNPHFITSNNPRPKIATKGDGGMRLSIQLELKLLADLALVGLPNAGKSTLLRSLSNSRARVGNWAFTTLQPNIGTVVLDDHKGRPSVTQRRRHGEPRVNFTIADVPGLIEDAHLDKGLGLGFLRHIERAAVLAFVVDLSAGDAIAALKGLWKEVAEYEALRGKELNAETERRMVNWKPPVNSQFRSQASTTDQTAIFNASPSQPLSPLSLPPISSKPWFVVATKADLPETQTNYQNLKRYLEAVKAGNLSHPSGRKNAWMKTLHSVPVSAIRAEGVEAIPELVMGLLDG